MKSEDNKTELVFLGTGAAWALPELNCPCAICANMRAKGERRTRTALLLEADYTLLVDCGPDILAQLETNKIKKIDAVLITHEHGDHYIGLDELFVFKRNQPRGRFKPIAVFMTPQSWEVIRTRFDYLRTMGVIEPRMVHPFRWFESGPFAIYPFKTDHGTFAKGSVGYLIKMPASGGGQKSVLYTSDFKNLPDIPDEIKRPDLLVIQSFWFNEPKENRPSHMSFQRALQFIEALDPVEETFLVHMGDADMVPGDPHNSMAKKYEPLNPLAPPGSNTPYPIPLDHDQWNEILQKVLSDYRLLHEVRVARDGLSVPL